MGQVYVERRTFKVILLGCEDLETKSEGMTIIKSMLQCIRKNMKYGHQSMLETIFTVQTDNKGEVDLKIQDTAGQERYKSLTTSFFRHAYASIIVFDITDQKAFDKVRDWHVILSINRAHLKSSNIFLVATIQEQCELTTDSREARQFAEENDIYYSEVNIADELQVKSFFTDVANHIVQNLKETSITTSTIHLSKSYESSKEKKKCSC